MKRFLLSLLMAMGIAIVPVASAVAQPAADDQTYVSEITGEEVDLGASGDILFIPENFDFYESGEFQEEYIWFTTGYSNFQLVMVVGPVTPADYTELTLDNMVEFYDGWEVLEEETTDEAATFTGLATLNNRELIVYYEYRLDVWGDTDQVLMQFTEPTTLVDDMQTVQDEVTVGGEPILDGTDAEAIAAGAGIESDTTSGDDEDDDTGTSSRTSRTSSTDDDEDVSTPESDEDDEGSSTSGTRTSRGSTDTTGNSTETGDDEEDVSTPESDDDDSTGTTGSSRTGRTSTTASTDDDVEEDDATAVAGGDWSDMGLVSDSEWESPSHGSVVTWDAETWEFPLDYDQAIIINDDPPYDILTLQTTDGLGYVYITVDTAEGSTPTSMVEWWSSQEYADRFEQGITIVEVSSTGNTASVVYETTNMRDQSLFVVVEATFLDDGTMIISQISAAPTTIHEVYGQFVDGVEVDGAPLDTTWTVEDVQDLSGN